MAEMRADVQSLLSAGHVSVRGHAAHEPPTSIELPSGGIVILYGTELVETQLAAALPGGAGDPFADFPSPMYRVQALPLCSVSLDEANCIGGHSLLVLRHLAGALAAGGARAGVLHALAGWTRRRPSDFGQADLHVVACAEWKQMNFSFGYELPVYASLLTPVLARVPAADPMHAEARRLLSMLAPFEPLPLAWLPTNSPTRVFAGGAWL